MFSAAARGIPSFGDLAWKAPVDWASDPSQSFLFPFPILNPATNQPGQTLTKDGNGNFNDETPVSGASLSVGDRVLLAGPHASGDVQGLWIITTLGDASTPWVLTRATDGNLPTKLPEGTITIAKGATVDGSALLANQFPIYLRVSSSWFIVPRYLQALTVDFGTVLIGENTSTDPAAIIFGTLALDTIWFDEANRDTILQRAGAGVLELVTTGSNQARIGTQAPSGQRSIYTARIEGESVIRALFGGDDTITGMELGSGSASRDTNLYRDAANKLKTDDSLEIDDRIAFSGIISPPQITANTNNYNPTGLATSTMLRLSTDASRNLTGIVAPATDLINSIICILNVGAQNIVLIHDATSTAANRFLCPGSANLTLTPNSAAWVWYDNASSRWRVIR